MAQAFRAQSPRSLTVGALVPSQASPCGICGGPHETAIEFSPSTHLALSGTFREVSVFPPYSFTTGVTYF